MKSGSFVVFPKNTRSKMLISLLPIVIVHVYMFGEWGRYSRCSADCGWGQKRRSRSCQQVNLKTMQTLKSDLDPSLCAKANAGLEGTETVFCMMKECKVCDFGNTNHGTPFQWQTIVDTKIVRKKTPYESTFKLEMTSENQCGQTCGTRAGCTGFIFSELKCENDECEPNCELVMGPFETDENAQGVFYIISML